MNGFDIVLMKQLDKYRMPGELQESIKKNLHPKNNSQTIDDAINEYLNAVRDVGYDPGGVTTSDKSTYRFFLEKYFNE